MRVMIRLLPLLAAVGILPTWAADETTSSSTGTTTGKGMLTLDGTITGKVSDAATPTGHYLSYTSTITLSNGHGSVIVGSHTVTGTDTATTTASNSTGTTTGTSNSLTVLAGSQTRLVNGTANATMTASASASASPVVNTQPCNGYPEFCARNYSNITVVAAHNSPFVKPGSVAANQALQVVSQLDDGVRMCKCTDKEGKV
jgi:hypothetical protein